MRLDGRDRGLRAVLDFLAGVTDAPPQRCPRWLTSPIFWGLWWGALALAVYVFSGQTSKFIYIDF